MNIRQKYKYSLSEIEESYIEQLALKSDKNYENWADENFIQITNYLITKYPQIKIEKPEYRIKSDKSLLGKIKNLQIERLSKLSIVEGLSEEQEQELYKLIEERVYEKPQEDEEKMLKNIKKLIQIREINETDIIQMVKKISDIDLDIELGKEQAEEFMMRGTLSESTKTALLRVLVGKIEKSNIEYKWMILQLIDRLFGKAAAERLEIKERDLIRYESIEAIRRNPKKREELKDIHSFLKAKDLIGMKIIISEVPDDFQTQNERIKEILEKRKNAKTPEEYKKHDHAVCIELGKEFIDSLNENTELLQTHKREIIPESRKHKKKANGYEADHIKFMSEENENYTFELQVWSKYIKQIAKQGGTAAHDQRPGKTRIFPRLDDPKFIDKIKFVLPKYKELREKEGEYKELYCNTLIENCEKYFEKQLTEGTELYHRLDKKLEDEICV